MKTTVPKSGATRFTAAGKRMDLGRYTRPELTATVRVGDRCSMGTVGCGTGGRRSSSSRERLSTG